MITDKIYCMSSFLMYRTIADNEKCFTEGLIPEYFQVDFPRRPVHNSEDLENALREQMEEWTKDGKAALALSGGIDSAILAKYMPKGSTAYTFKCIVPGVSVTDETSQAAEYAKACGLNHKIIEIYWEDFETLTPVLVKHKGAPIHSIEVQIYKAALRAKSDGVEKLIFGESSDANYGGLSGLMSKEWSFGEFVDRYTYVKPYYVLKECEMDLNPYQKYEKGGFIDVHEFLRNFFLAESMGSYMNACRCAGLGGALTPYVGTVLAEPLDYTRIRRGENKYIVRELFSKLYPDFTAPPKLPMPRAVNEWLEGWTGPERPEFYPHCTEHMTGDQKWLVLVLEWFLNLIETGDEWNARCPYHFAG